MEKAVKADSSIAEDLNEIGMEFFQARQYGPAARIFEIATLNPESKNYLYDYFYMGYALYFDYATRVNDEVKPSKTLLEKADVAFGKVTELAQTTDAAYLFRARANRLLDDEANPQGLFVPYYQEFIDVVKGKGKNR